MPIDIAPNEAEPFRIDGGMRLDAWRISAEQAHDLASISAVCALASHKFSVARGKGAIEPQFWRDLFDIIHQRRDALLSELAAALRAGGQEAGHGQSVAPRGQ